MNDVLHRVHTANKVTSKSPAITHDSKERHFWINKR